MQVPVAPLGQANANELLDGALGGDPTVQPLKPFLVSRTEGNPFFLEESVRSLVEIGALVGERGAYRLTLRLEGIRVPATVQAVLAARIDRLPTEEKRLLQTASVIGKDVPFVLLQAVSDVLDGDLRAGLSRLQAAELLYAVCLYPEPEYTFKHALTHEVAYGSLLQERRKELHPRIVAAIERLHPDRLEEHVERLAHHAVAGDVWDKAVTYSRQAGARSRARSDHQAAVASFEQALLALQHLPESRHSREQAIDLRFDLRNALVPLGGANSNAYELLREAEALAAALGDQRRLGRAYAYLTEQFAEAGDPDRAVESGQHALAIAEIRGDLSIQVTANRHLGRVYLALGEYCRAIEFQRRNVATLEGELLYQYLGAPLLQSVSSRAWLAWPLAEIGDFDEAIAVAQEGLRIAEVVGQPLSLVTAHLGIGVVRVRRGDSHEAVSALERGLALCDVWSIEPWRNRFQSALGSAYILAGRAADALQLLQR